MRRVDKTYDEALPRFESADLLLCRGQSWFSRGIRIASLSEYSHAAMLAYRNGVPVVLDVLQWRGGSSRPLRQEVADKPGLWDHYKVNTLRFREFDRESAERRMWEFDGIDYGWPELSRASVMYLPIVRLLQKIEKFVIDDEATGKTPPFCSMAYAIACEAGGVDPVNNLRHSMTTPGDLSRSKVFDYVCTLVNEQALFGSTV